MASNRRLRSLGGLFGLALAAVVTAGHAQSADAAASSRFELRDVKTEPKRNLSASGRFGVVAQAQTRFVNAAGKRFALLGAAQCVAGEPTPGIFANGFE